VNLFLWKEWECRKI